MDPNMIQGQNQFGKMGGNQFGGGMNRNMGQMNPMGQMGNFNQMGGNQFYMGNNPYMNNYYGGGFQQNVQGGFQQNMQQGNFQQGTGTPQHKGQKPMGKNPSVKMDIKCKIFSLKEY